MKFKLYGFSCISVEVYIRHVLCKWFYDFLCGNNNLINSVKKFYYFKKCVIRKKYYNYIQRMWCKTQWLKYVLTLYKIVHATNE